MAVAFGLLLLWGCATARPVTVRTASKAEGQHVVQALVPLLRELGYAFPRGPHDCRIALAVLRSESINAAVGPGREQPCTFFSLGVSEGAVRRLPVDMLRAILAHELGHVYLGHLETRRERRDQTPRVLQPLGRRFDRQEEADADAFAVDLLRRLEPQHQGACMALVRVFALLGKPGGELERWFAVHPAPDRRAERAQAACNG